MGKEGHEFQNFEQGTAEEVIKKGESGSTGR